VKGVLAHIHPGRFSATLDGDFVVFLVGMRINRPLRPRGWLPVFTAMPRMLRELDQHPELGCLSSSLGLMYGGPAVVQQWRSFEALEAYAREKDAKHLPAWRAFNQRTRGNGDIGVWHETYRVAAGAYESIYVNMPAAGLAKAGEHEPLGSTSTAKERLLASRA
jgi:hypothetical protein